MQRPHQQTCYFSPVYRPLSEVKREHIFVSDQTSSIYLPAKVPSGIVLWDPTVAAVPFFQRTDVNENDVRARVV